MGVDEVLIEIQSRQDDCIRGAFPCSKDVERWCGSSIEHITGPMLDAIALGIARKYRVGALSFELADAVMNELYVIFITAKRTRPDIFMGPFFLIFDAFDAGEWHREPDGSDNPVEEFTDPLIDKYLRDYPA